MYAIRSYYGRDGLRALKVKLTGVDPDADFRRLVSVGRMPGPMKHCASGVQSSRMHSFVQSM